MTKIKSSKEEKAAQKARQQQIRQLWQSAGIKDIAGVESLIQEMKKVLIEDMYQAELDTHLGLTPPHKYYVHTLQPKIDSTILTVLEK